ncbi:hypothetical protein [Treponema pedis]|uniref:hypothetical protein n=1 Tax=Treponema pedis TaxID=409322 RepID=UPI0003F823B0|nr:hypothetical protein [Treponema pedis]
MTGNANLFVIHKDSKSFSYKSNSLTEIAAYINKWGNSGGNYYLLARIEKGYYNLNGKFISTGGHTVNINAKSNNVSNLDDLLNAFNIGINNTQEGHPTGDTITKNSVWKITRIDVLQSIKLPDNAN